MKQTTWELDIDLSLNSLVVEDHYRKALKTTAAIATTTLTTATANTTLIPPATSPTITPATPTLMLVAGREEFETFLDFTYKKVRCVCVCSYMLL